MAITEILATDSFATFVEKVNSAIKNLNGGLADSSLVKEFKTIDDMKKCTTLKVDDICMTFGDTEVGDDIVKAFRVVSSKTDLPSDDNLEYYILINNKYAYNFAKFNGGGSGGGGGAIIGTLTSEFNKTTVNSTEDVVIDYFFSSPNLGKGTLTVLLNGAEKVNKLVPQGNGSIDLGTLPKGDNKIQIYIVDVAGVFTNQLNFNVYCGSLDLTSTFNGEAEYSITSQIKYPYTIDTVSTDPIYLKIKIGDAKGTVYQDTISVESKNGYNSYIFPSIAPGVHKVKIWAESGIYVSETLTYNIVIQDADNLYVSTSLEETTFEEGTTVSIPYRISMKNQTLFDVVQYIDNVQFKLLECNAGINYWNISTLKVGTHLLAIKVTTKDKLHTETLNISLNIIEGEIKTYDSVTQGLMCSFDAKDHSNRDLSRETWEDISGNNIEAKLHGFNYGTNGWIDNALVCNGSSYVSIDLSPLKDNATNGLTVDILYEAKDIGNTDALVLDCSSNDTDAVKNGFWIDTLNAYLQSQSHMITSAYSENEKTRVTYVIDRENRLAEVYINAIMCECVMLTDLGTGGNTIYENFAHKNIIYLNSKKGTSDFGDCKIYKFRVYERALSSEEILQNHIADLPTPEEQKEKYDFNYNNTMPTIYMYGDTSAMTKENKVTLRVKYLATEGYGQSFDLENCQVNWQGTSSIQYTVKNYKVKLRYANGDKYKYTPFGGDSLPESTFCLKADYMESSHMNNTGLAQIVNDYLYDEKVPPQVDNPGVRTAINGFPIQLYINDELIGVYNFNYDKGDEDTFGFDADKYPECQSFEVTANSTTTAGAFHKWTSDMTKTITNADGTTTTVPLPRDEYLLASFEVRWCPDEENVNLDNLNDLVTWVDDSTDEEFKTCIDNNEHFNKHFLLRYYLQTLMFGMVDNLGKNMMINTWDGKTWYPTFYDMDTCLGLDNSGYLRFDSDIDVTPSVYNTCESVLWTKVRRIYIDDLKTEWASLRSKLYTYDNIIGILKGRQVDKISERLYNLDAQNKYIQFGKTYLYMLHGSRVEHMRRWVRERLLYLDTVFGYDVQTVDSITIRTDYLGKISFAIQTYSPQYLTIKWNNSQFDTKRIGRGETVTFSHTNDAKDQEIIIYNARFIKDLGDISNVQPKSMIIDNAEKLTRLVCHSTSLGSISTKENPLLQKLDLSGCTSLGTATASATVFDISSCTGLKVVNIKNTKITNLVSNPDGGNLEEIYYPDTIQDINISNMYNLRILAIPVATSSYTSSCTTKASNLASLRIVNCPRVEQITDSKMSHDTIHEMWNYLSFISVENLTIDNSLLADAKTFKEVLCLPRLQHLKKLTLANLSFKTLKLDGCSNNLSIESITITNCTFEEINFDAYLAGNYSWNLSSDGNLVNFTENYVLDLTGIASLKRLINTSNLNNLVKILLPSSIETVQLGTSTTIKLQYNGSDTINCSVSCSTPNLTTIDIPDITGHDSTFTGIDLGNQSLVDSVFGSITKAIDVSNVNLVAKTVFPHWSNNLNSLEGNLDATNFKGTSLKGFFSTLALPSNKKYTVNLGANTLSTVTDLSSCLVGVQGLKDTDTENLAYFNNIINLLTNTSTKKVYSCYGMFNGSDLQTFAPEYVLYVSSANSMFSFSNLVTIGENIDFTECTQIDNIFNFQYGSPHIKYIYFKLDAPKVHLSSYTRVFCYNGSSCPSILTPFYFSVPNSTNGGGEIFYTLSGGISEFSKFNIASFTADAGIHLNGLVTIHKLTPPKNCTMNNTLVNCPLRNVDFEGKIYKSCTFNQSKLTVESLVNIINALTDLTGQTAQTLTLGSTNIAKLSEEQLAIATNKNWTIA